MNYDYVFKILFIGESGVGKSTLAMQFAGRGFVEDMPTTIGVDFLMHQLEIEGKNIKMTFWDTAGAERFRTLTKSYYRGATGVILAYDVTKPETFAAVEQWLVEVDLHTTHRDVVKMLVGNKTDLRGRRVSSEQGEAFARTHGMLFVETSCKTGDGVRRAIEELALKILETPSLLELAAAPPVAQTADLAAQPAAGSAGCALPAC